MPIAGKAGECRATAGGKQYGKSFFMELNVCSPDGISEAEYLPRRNENTCPHQSLYVIVHSSSVCNRQT